MWSINALHFSFIFFCVFFFFCLQLLFVLYINQGSIREAEQKYFQLYGIQIYYGNQNLSIFRSFGEQWSRNGCCSISKKACLRQQTIQSLLKNLEWDHDGVLVEQPMERLLPLYLLVIWHWHFCGEKRSGHSTRKNKSQLESVCTSVSFSHCL